MIRLPEFPLSVTVPSDAHTLDGFRCWARSEEFPKRGKVSLIDGDVLIDMHPERIESHVNVKTEIYCILGRLVKRYDWGRFFPSGVWLTNDQAALSDEPDALFVAWESFHQNRLRMVLEENGDDGIELAGSPDWVLEIVSPTSMRRDTVLLVDAYHQAGVAEYWLVDARGDEIQFTMYRWEYQGYQAVEPVGGRLASPVFGREFHLERCRDRIGGWSYTLNVR